MIIAYARKDIPSFPLEEQKKYLSEYHYDCLYVDNEKTGADVTQLYELLHGEDKLVICELACLELTMLQLPDFFENLKQKHVKFVSIIDGICIDKFSSSTFLYYLNFIARTESKVKSNLTIKGLNQAKEKGRLGGRPAISPDIIKEIKALNECGKYSYRQIADICNVSLGVVHKYLKSKKVERMNEWGTQNL